MDIYLNHRGSSVIDRSISRTFNFLSCWTHLPQRFALFLPAQGPGEITFGGPDRQVLETYRVCGWSWRRICEVDYVDWTWLDVNILLPSAGSLWPCRARSMWQSFQLHYGTCVVRHEEQKPDRIWHTGHSNHMIITAKTLANKGIRTLWCHQT